ncbi:MAG: Hsp20/alpha crystallin family protein [Acidobacteria bacterium]|nr:MAG: Hsp20/alpha crystallin family protein [Acidobacteriota bacterium]
MAERQTEVARREERELARREPFPSVGEPFRMLERFADEMDHLFDEFGLGRGWFGPRLGFGLTRPLLRRAEGWLPSIEVLQRNNQLVIRADLPGIAKDDIKLEITEDAVTIQGERRQEHEEEKAGVYRSERSYGSFCRVVALPQGAMTDQAKASFKDGVLEITMPAPPEAVTRGRKLEITESASPKK